MFGHIFVNRLKCAVRDRQTIFWSFLFPLVLATLFSLAFSNLNKGEVFHTIPLGVVTSEAYAADSYLREDLLNAKTNGNEDMFAVSEFADSAQAEQSLKEDKIAGYIAYKDGKPGVVVRKSGLNQTLIAKFVERYLQISQTVGEIGRVNHSAVPGAIEQLAGQGELMEEVSPTDAAPNDTLTYYYALIAMACLYGGFWGMKEVMTVQADQSAEGARVNLAPVHKMKVFASSLCAVILVHFASVLVLIAYLRLAMHVEFGANLGYVLLASLLGSCMGVMMGAVIAAISKGKESIKVALNIVISMVFSFLSGLMVADIKYIVSVKAPILAYLNPANLVADAFYALYYYTSHARYFLNIGLLAAFSLVFFLIVTIVMRRQRYESL